MQKFYFLVEKEERAGFLGCRCVISLLIFTLKTLQNTKEWPSFHHFSSPMPLPSLLRAFINTEHLISCPATLRCERKGIRICIILERSRAVTLWTQGGHRSCSYPAEAVNWQHLLCENICSPAGLHDPYGEGARCKSQGKSDEGEELLTPLMEDETRYEAKKGLIRLSESSSSHRACGGEERFRLGRRNEMERCKRSRKEVQNKISI